MRAPPGALGLPGGCARAPTPPAFAPSRSAPPLSFLAPRGPVAAAQRVHFFEIIVMRLIVVAPVLLLIPTLGSQIYAMPGRVSRLHLEAGRPGLFRGQNQQLNGSGYLERPCASTSCAIRSLCRTARSTRASSSRTRSSWFNTLASNRARRKTR